MGVSALALLLPLAVAQTPELVVLPLATDGVKASQGVDAWKQITAQVERSRKKLKVSTSLQKKQHDFLVGPAREQAGDCGFKVGCLSEVGSTLGAQILVAGRVEKKAVVLTAIDVRNATKIGEVRSSKKYAKRSLKQKSRSVSRSLVRVLLAHLKKSNTVAAATPKSEDRSDRMGNSDKIEDPKVDPAMGGAGQSDSDTMAKLDDFDDPPSATDGTILISKSQLGGVSSVTIDNTPVPFAGDGSVQFTGAPGTHRLVATRVDGQVVKKDVRINPNDITQVTLEFVAVTPPPPPATEVADDEPVTGKWWFWTSIGAAVAAGSATAIFLASGEKGGPSIPSSSGSIRGTY